MLVTPCRNKEASKSRDLRQSKRFEQEDKELKMEVEKSGFVEVPKLQPYKISPAMARHAFEFELILIDHNERYPHRCSIYSNRYII